MEGQYCDYLKGLVCYEDKKCETCNIYFKTMPIPWDIKEDVDEEVPDNIC